MQTPLSREAILDYLGANHDDLRSRFRLARVAVIGSVARDDYTDSSDVDLIVRFEPNTERIRERKRELCTELESVFGRPVQIASEKYLKPYYRTNILKEAVDV